MTWKYVLLTMTCVWHTKLSRHYSTLSLFTQIPVLQPFVFHYLTDLDDFTPAPSPSQSRNIYKERI
jgi:hypothetical protein